MTPESRLAIGQQRAAEPCALIKARVYAQNKAGAPQAAWARLSLTSDPRFVASKRESADAGRHNEAVIAQLNAAKLAALAPHAPPAAPLGDPPRAAAAPPPARRAKGGGWRSRAAAQAADDSVEVLVDGRAVRVPTRTAAAASGAAERATTDARSVAPADGAATEVASGPLCEGAQAAGTPEVLIQRQTDGAAPAIPSGNAHAAAGARTAVVEGPGAEQILVRSICTTGAVCASTQPDAAQRGEGAGGHEGGSKREDMSLLEQLTSPTGAPAHPTAESPIEDDEADAGGGGDVLTPEELAAQLPALAVSGAADDDAVGSDEPGSAGRGRVEGVKAKRKKKRRAGNREARRQRRAHDGRLPAPDDAEGAPAGAGTCLRPCLRHIRQLSRHLCSAGLLPLFGERQSLLSAP